MQRSKELQRLILLEERDKEPQPKKQSYSEEQVLANLVLLINDGFVDGQIFEDGNGSPIGAVMTNISSKGHDFLDEFETREKLIIKAVSVPQKVFVSHSSADQDLAEALLDLLCQALHLRRADFLCTSVPGSKLQGGDRTDSTLRRAIVEVPAFLSILSPKAVISTYVLFELGARWGIDKHHIPLLAKGAGAEILKEPLKSTNALKLSSEHDVLQLVTDLATILGINPEPPASFISRVKDVVRISNVVGTSPAELAEKPAPINDKSSGLFLTPASGGWRHPSTMQQMTVEAAQLLVEACKSKDGNVSMHTNSQGQFIVVHGVKDDFMGDFRDLRNRAKWIAAFELLVAGGCFAHLQSAGSAGIYRITETGYNLADRFKQA